MHRVRSYTNPQLEAFSILIANNNRAEKNPRPIHKYLKITRRPSILQSSRCNKRDDQS